VFFNRSLWASGAHRDEIMKGAAIRVEERTELKRSIDRIPMDAHLGALHGSSIALLSQNPIPRLLNAVGKARLLLELEKIDAILRRVREDHDRHRRIRGIGGIPSFLSTALGLRSQRSR